MNQTNDHLKELIFHLSHKMGCVVTAEYAVVRYSKFSKRSDIGLRRTRDTTMWPEICGRFMGGF